ncbi:hypothetical protein GQ607_013978 [Colletotrichum asianum]|uniref:Uncharacterized protein n=1 Tax=Colletotrichum asianum TaxID=702518 RepID=A0A8H3W469_9PEZI|nr:hypothetical protein GQ607_013978 [Colletotrichum asianum]
MADAPQCNCPKYETQDSDGKPVVIYRHGDACPNSGKTPQPRIAIATMAAAQNCWETGFGWSPEYGRGHCAIEANACVCEGCNYERFTSSNIACCG